MGIEVAANNTATVGTVLEDPGSGPFETQGEAFEAGRIYHDARLTDMGFEVDPTEPEVYPEHIYPGQTARYRIMYRKQGKRGYIYRCLAMSIFRYDHSGRYELVAYVG